MSCLGKHSSMRTRTFQEAVRSISASALRSASTACRRVTVGNAARMSPRLTPSARFSKSTRTGTRVPAKTGVPPKISGPMMLSREEPKFGRISFAAKSWLSSPHFYRHTEANRPVMRFAVWRSVRFGSGSRIRSRGRLVGDSSPRQRRVFPKRDRAALTVVKSIRPGFTCVVRSNSELALPTGGATVNLTNVKRRRILVA